MSKRDTPDTHTPSNHIKIEIRLKLTGTALLDMSTGQLDWGSTRLHGSLIPVIKGSGEETIGEVKPLTKRDDLDFVHRLSAHFSKETRIKVPPKRSSVYIHAWKTPFIRMLGQVWFSAGYDYARKDRDFMDHKYADAALIAVATLVNDTVAKMRNGEKKLFIKAPTSLEGISTGLSSETDYIQKVVESKRAKGIILSLPQKQ
ncbi:MAG: hypothetical protein DRI46_10325 [Chloroflexi bacterium]|nr:MAG: hypothetical protein DRI46_10325 [Chloroflexota bacterium]